MSTSFTKTRARKYLKELKKMKQTHVTATQLAFVVGILDSVIRDEFAQFDPMVRMFYDYNLKKLLPELEAFCLPKSNTGKKRTLKVVKGPYRDINDFVYKTMCGPGGIVNPKSKLTINQLGDLRRLLNVEMKRSKEKREG